MKVLLKKWDSTNLIHCFRNAHHKNFFMSVANKIKNLTNQHLLLLDMIACVHSFKYSVVPHPSKEEVDEAIRITRFDYHSIMLVYFDAVLEDLPIKEIESIFIERFNSYLNLGVGQSHLRHLIDQKLIKLNKTSYGKKRPCLSSYILGLETENELFFLEMEIGRKVWNLWHDLELQYAVPTSAGRKIILEIGKNIILTSQLIWAKNKESQQLLLLNDMTEDISN